MRSTPFRRRIATAAFTIGGTLMAFSIFAASPAKADTGPTPYAGNPTCADLGYANSFKIDDIVELPAEGDYTPATPKTEEIGTIPAGFKITLDNVEIVSGKAQFDWAASATSGPFPIDVVLVKAGPGGNKYSYSAPGATSDTDLVSPKGSISHITFCWDSTTTGTDGPTDDGTTTDGTTTDGTTTDGTTTDGTTTDGTTTDGSTTDSGSTGSVAPTSGETDTEVLGEVVRPQQLPRTGSEDRSLFILGIGFLAIGAVAMVAKRELFIRS